MYKENNTPKVAPNNVAKEPIVKPTRKNIFLIDFLVTPNDLNIAISLDLFFSNCSNKSKSLGGPIW